jgi:hypothetical protein
MSMSAEELAKRREEVGRGREVAALIANETFKQVLNDSLHGIQNAWLREQDRDQREYLWQQGAGLQAFADNLRSIVDTGKMAEQQLETDRKLRGDHEKA